MFFSPLGYALLLGVLLQLPGLMLGGKRAVCLSLASFGVVVVLVVCIVRHDALLFLAQLFLLPVLFVVSSGGAALRGAAKQAAGRDDD